jgi:hypothetical protein
LAGSVLIGTVLTAGSTFASTAEMNRRIKTNTPNVVGVISTISGNTLIVNSRKGKASRSYTVDATNAKVIKDGTTTAISNIAIGDKVVIKGSIKGTRVIAKSIRDNAKSRKMNNKVS